MLYLGTRGFDLESDVPACHVQPCSDREVYGEATSWELEAMSTKPGLSPPFRILKLRHATSPLYPKARAVTSLLYPDCEVASRGSWVLANELAGPEAYCTFCRWTAWLGYGLLSPTVDKARSGHLQPTGSSGGNLGAAALLWCIWAWAGNSWQPQWRRPAVPLAAHVSPVNLPQAGGIALLAQLCLFSMSQWDMETNQHRLEK